MSAPTRKPFMDDTPELLEEFVQTPKVKGSIRTLKPPPEIWELVHPIATNRFKPGKALVTRLATKNVLLTLMGFFILVSVTMGLWKFPIVQHVLAMLPKDDVPSKVRTAKATQSRTAEQNSRSKVVVAPVAESLNASTSDADVSLDVIRTSIKSRTVVRQPARKLNRTNIQKQSVAALTPLPIPDAERSAIRSSRSVAKPQTESSVKTVPQAKSSDSDPSASTSGQTAKPKVIPWP